MFVGEPYIDMNENRIILFDTDLIPILAVRLCARVSSLSPQRFVELSTFLFHVPSTFSPELAEQFRSGRKLPNSSFVVIEQTVSIYLDASCRIFCANTTEYLADRYLSLSLSRWTSLLSTGQ